MNGTMPRGRITWFRMPSVRVEGSKRAPGRPPKNVTSASPGLLIPYIRATESIDARRACTRLSSDS